MATKTIGPSGDYTTLAAYATYLDTLNVLSAPEIGELQNTTFSVGGSQVLFTGFTPSSTNTWTLRTASGAGFKDNASAATNRLAYNASNGAAITGSVDYDWLIKVSGVPFAIIQNLQAQNTSTNGLGFAADGDDLLVENCIFQSAGAAAAQYGNIVLSGLRPTLKNVLSVSLAAQTGINVDNGGTLINCTVVRPTNLTAANSGIRAPYGGLTIKNCVIARFTTAIDVAGTNTGSNNAIDAASYPSGITGQVSLTMATEFENPSNASSVMDWRLKSTSVKCKDLGTNTATTTTDIIGQAISNATRDVGAWELQQGGGGTQTLTPSLFTNSPTFYAPTVTRGAVTLAPSLFTNSNTFYAPTVTRGAVTLTPSLFTNSNTFYSPTVSQGGTQTLTPSLFTNTNTFYGPTITVGAVTLTPSLFTNSSTFYAATVTRGTITLTPSLFTNSATFYGPTVTRGAATLSPALFTNASTFYGPTVTRGAVTLTPALFTNTSVFYSPTVYVPGGSQTLLPSLFTNLSVFYAAAVNQNDPPGTYPLAIEGGGSVVLRKLAGGGSVVAGSIPSSGRVVLGSLRGRP